jgi:hypothetical protein
MTETITQDPATFDVEGWLQDAKLPEESATVYKRADVVAELSDLKRRIELEARASGAEYTAADPALTPLEQEYQALLETFSKSALTVYVRALTEQELRTLRLASEAATQNLSSDAQNEHLGYEILARSITAVKPAGAARQSVVFTPAKVKALKDAIGTAQMQVILNARLNAQNAVPAVDADFLHKRSGTEAGAE